MGNCQDSQGFTGIHETLGEDLWGFVDLQGFMRICKNLGEDS